MRHRALNHNLAERGTIGHTTLEITGTVEHRILQHRAFEHGTLEQNFGFESIKT